MLIHIAAIAILTNIALLELYSLYIFSPEFAHTSFSFKNSLHRVFVYGTLKRGEPNHAILKDINNGYAKFLGLGKTITRYPLVIATKYNIPFLLEKEGTGSHVLGEVYDVDSKMLMNLDELEEHPSFYVRTEHKVQLIPESEIEADVPLDKASNVTKAWIYLLPKFRPSLLEETMYSSYSNEGSHGLKYKERYLRDPLHNHRNDVR